MKPNINQSSKSLELPPNVMGFKEEAKSALNIDSWNYLDGAAESESSKNINENAYRRLKLIPRVLTNNEVRDQSIELLGYKYRSPVALAPTSPLRLFHEDAEMAQIKAAKKLNALAIYSADSHYDLDQVGAESNKDAWFQLYAYGGKSETIEMLSKVKSAGFKAVVVTVDAFYAARRERMISSKFIMPDYVKMGNILDIQKNPKYRRPDGSIKRMIFTWDDLKWIKESSGLPIIIKGIMSAEDALTALEYNISGIIVSNHGGRQLDDTPSTLDCLNLISKKIGQSSGIDLLVDGGIYRGVDVLKAIAYGAKAVLIGRPYVYALAARGQYGIESVLQMLWAEIDNAMSQLGISSLDELNGSFLYKEKN